jgi:hypothetical protein
VTYFFQQDPTPKISRTSQNSTTIWGPSVEHMSLWEIFYFQTVAQRLKNIFSPKMQNIEVCFCQYFTILTY